MDKIKQLNLPHHARVIVISDIHGELELFKKLLEDVRYTEADYLIINGDLCEKGSNSQGVVRFVMELSEINPQVHVTEGNCDTLPEDLMEENPGLINYLIKRPNSIINEWLHELDYTVSQESDVHEIKELVMPHFGKEVMWLSQLPTAIETEDYIFVHAGLDNVKDWKETDRVTAITLPSFLDRSHQTNKYVIVGHWPVVNYSTDIPVNNPIIDEEKKIITMDGGNVIKRTGQLNAFVIDRSPKGDQFSYTYVDHLPSREVIKDFTAAPSMLGSITYPHYAIEPIEKGDHFTLCKQLDTGRQLFVKNEYININEEGQHMVKTDISCAQMSVKAGEMVSIVEENCSGFTLIKKEGEEGWIQKDSLAK